MLLRRVVEHVRKQEWTAIGIDFLIVVIGVFVGIQVSNWNSARIAQAEEQRLVSQLLADVDTEISQKSAWLDQASIRLETFREAVGKLQADGPAAELTRAECESAAYSHIIDIRIASLPTLEEIQFSGGLGMLSDPELRHALLRYRSGSETLGASYDFVREDFANLVDSFGAAFPRRLAAEKALISDVPISSRVECDTAAIFADANLQNRLMSNLARTQALIDYGEFEIDLLTNVRNALNGGGE
jgi:hypothetical protein